MLKNYQENTLEALQRYLKLCAETKNVVSSYALCTKENFNIEGIYNNPLGNQSGMFENQEKPIVPYVCLRLPTGGGKTILAAHSISKICKEYLSREHCLVLWLVPTNTILEQTYDALQDKRHFYRQAIDLDFNGKVEVMKVSDALGLSKSNLDGNLNIIVSTLASWRITSTEGRKVYEDNGALLHHFENIDSNIRADLEFIDEKNTKLKHSLANVVYLNNPIIIIDEAHNAKTPLTYDTIERLNPSCIVEFTATPKASGADRSNLLYNVSASTLKAEQMIKMPIELLTTEHWQTALQDAVDKQKELEKIASEEENQTGEYIRPIVLIQAEDDRQNEETISVSLIKEYLLNTINIPESQIAIATGNERGLEGIDLNSNKCEIRYIITKQALKEGWDCPFAYILCSVKDSKSGKDVEQLLGRILRLPKVKSKNHIELNKAYSYVCSKSFFDVAKNLTDCLVDLGYHRAEASSMIEINKQQEELFQSFGFYTQEIIEPPTEIPDELKNKININYEKNTITFKEKLTSTEKDLLKKTFTREEDKKVIEDAYNLTYKFYKYSPQQQGKVLSIPQLLIDIDGEKVVYDEDALISPKWNLAECDVNLTETEFPVIVQAGELGIIDINGNGEPVIQPERQIEQELSRLLFTSSIDKEKLIKWLDNETRNYSVPYAQSIVFINKLIENLIKERKLSLEQLFYMRFKLKDAIKNKISFYVNEAKKSGFSGLFGTEFRPDNQNVLSKFSVGENFTFPNDYPANVLYDGRYQFQKHYYSVIAVMNTEETECAQNIDINNNVEFWVRNLERQEYNAFWLQTSTDKFYPDFIVKLNNGKIVVIEYKGEHLYGSEDSLEKRTIGNYWALLTNNTCSFVMLKGRDWNRLNEYLLAK